MIERLELLAADSPKVASVAFTLLLEEYVCICTDPDKIDKPETGDSPSVAIELLTAIVDTLGSENVCDTEADAAEVATVTVVSFNDDKAVDDELDESNADTNDDFNVVMERGDRVNECCISNDILKDTDRDTTVDVAIDSVVVGCILDVPFNESNEGVDKYFENADSDNVGRMLDETVDKSDVSATEYFEVAMDTNVNVNVGSVLGEPSENFDVTDAIEEVTVDDTLLDALKETINVATECFDVAMVTADGIDVGWTFTVNSGFENNVLAIGAVNDEAIDSCVNMDLSDSFLLDGEYEIVLFCTNIVDTTEDSFR